MFARKGRRAGWWPCLGSDHFGKKSNYVSIHSFTGRLCPTRLEERKVKESDACFLSLHINMNVPSLNPTRHTWDHFTNTVRVTFWGIERTTHKRDAFREYIHISFHFKWYFHLYRFTGRDSSICKKHHIYIWRILYIIFTF